MTESLRDELEKAMDAPAGDAAPPPDKAPSVPATVPADTSALPAAVGERPRGPDGKFLSKEQAPGLVPAAAPPAGTEPKPETMEAPARWTVEEKAAFAKWPPEARKEIAAHYGRMEADYTRKTQEAAAMRREAEPLLNLFAPHREELALHGLTPETVIRRWAAAEQRLQRDPQSAIRWLAETYGVDLDALAAEAPQTDPTLAPLETRLGQVEAAIRANGRNAAEAGHRQGMAAIDAFAQQKDAQGNLLHPHLDKVALVMLGLAHQERAAGRAPDLAVLYDTAVWANPETRESMLAAQRDSAKAAAAAEADAKAKAAALEARKAGASVTGAPRPGGTHEPPRSLREELEAAVSEHPL